MQGERRSPYLLVVQGRRQPNTYSGGLEVLPRDTMVDHIGRRG